MLPEVHQLLSQPTIPSALEASFMPVKTRPEFDPERLRSFSHRHNGGKGTLVC